MTIYAFQCIMRCPAYSSSEEEPDYYGRYGQEIHSSGNKKHQYMLGLCEEEEVKKAIEAIAPTALNDYPVSYTHLDVYKRQSQMCAAITLNCINQI